MRTTVLHSLLAVSLATAACGDTTGPEGAGSFALRFATADGSSPSHASGPSFSLLGAEEVTIEGTNGVLSITDIRFIVGEFKLERDEDACGEIEGEEEDDDSCEKFETGPYFVDLPLGTGSAPRVSQVVPAGSYTELKFEVEDIDLDEADDDDDAAEIRQVAEAIRAAGFTDWPSEASMVVVGTFTPTGGAAVPFTAYFEAEVKVEMEFETPLVIGEGQTDATVELDPTVWFKAFDGRVIDLSAYDFGTTGEVVEFEAKMEHGFTKIELDD